NLNLSSVDICFSGIGGRSVSKLCSFDLGRVRAFKPRFTVNFVVVCQILNRATACLQHPNYNLGVQVLNDYLKVVLEPFWNYKGLQRPSIPMLLREAIHLNDWGNYALYRSYRGAILFALKKLFSLAQRS
ncbi:unnamed protein product, partial [Porites evermanni]